MELEKAEIIANKVLKLLQPHCNRIAIGGSIRRQKRYVKDIEIVCIPKSFCNTDLFGDKTIMMRSNKFMQQLKNFKILRGKLDGKYIQCQLPEGIKLDVFTATPKNWGLILAIRTGSKEYSHNVLAKQWVRMGYKSKDGMLYKKDKEISTPEEHLFFTMLGLTYTEPYNRDW